MDVRFHPLRGAWPQPETKPGARHGRYVFKAGWDSTLDLLDRELFHLGARDVVVEVGLRDRDIRVDGWPRADAPAPPFPGVIVSFDSRHGPLRYLTDAFTDWQGNVRAIALGLEALRKVDRYGIGSRGEQYTGWKALPSGIELGPAPVTPAQAAATLVDLAGMAAVPDQLLDDAELTDRAYRAAAKTAHPDAGNADGGDLFVQLRHAYDVLCADQRRRRYR